MPTCLVTGGAGFLGSHLCDELLARGHRVICVDNLETGSLVNIEHIRDPQRFLHLNVDIIDPCWRWPDADLTRGATVTVSVGQRPFNFQIGKDADAIRRGDARTREGELEVRTGD